MGKARNVLFLESVNRCNHVGSGRDSLRLKFVWKFLHSLMVTIRFSFPMSFVPPTVWRLLIRHRCCSDAFSCLDVVIGVDELFLRALISCFCCFVNELLFCLSSIFFIMTQFLKLHFQPKLHGYKTSESPPPNWQGLTRYWVCGSQSSWDPIYLDIAAFN